MHQVSDGIRAVHKSLPPASTAHVGPFTCDVLVVIVVRSGLHENPVLVRPLHENYCALIVTMYRQIVVFHSMPAFES